VARGGGGGYCSVGEVKYRNSNARRRGIGGGEIKRPRVGVHCDEKRQTIWCTERTVYGYTWAEERRGSMYILRGEKEDAGNAAAEASCPHSGES